MPEILSVSAVARQLKISPRSLTDAFYRRRLSDEKCPIIGGRRCIPKNYVPEIVRVMKKLGVLGDGPRNKKGRRKLAVA